MSRKAPPVPSDALGTGVPRVLDPGDVEPAAAVIARAFAGDPSAVRLFPDGDERRRVTEVTAAAQVRAALPFASVHGIESAGALAAVAVWHPPAVSPHPLSAAARSGRAGLGVLPAIVRAMPRLGVTLAREQRELRQLMGTRRIAVHAATRTPAWYLALLATDPACQGHGLARRLLDHVLHRCDADDLGAWLETVDPRNPPIYERFGFHTIGFARGGTVVPGLWVMRRDPSSHRPH